MMLPWLSLNLFDQACKESQLQTNVIESRSILQLQGFIKVRYASVHACVRKHFFSNPLDSQRDTI